MFLKYVDFLFKPFRDIRAKIVGVKTVKGAIRVDVNRVKGMAGQGKKMAGNAKKKMLGAGAQAQAGMGQAQGAAAGAQQFMQQPPGAPGAPGAPGGINPNPPIKLVGLIFKKKVCTQCEQQLDQSWDTCAYCAEQAAAAAAASQKPMKTQAFMVGGGGSTGGGMQLLGWIVPIQGPQRGELFALSPQTVIGKDPASCTIVLQDGFMSSRHAEIKAEGGIWILKDLKSTNGTYVNDKKVDSHELVDNDVVMFGKCIVKFKSL
jgi:hypothetical protein